MIAPVKRIPRPVAFWLAGMSIGSFAAFVLVYTLVVTLIPIIAYQQPITFSDLFFGAALCALAFTLLTVAFRLSMAGYHSIKP